MSAPAQPPQVRIAVVQFCPVHEDVQTNINHVENLLKDLKAGTLDLLCLPEMCFTGYVFPDRAHLVPLLESPTSGPTSAFCQRTARRLGCHVVAGYPEAPAGNDELPEGKVGYNSAMVYSPEGLVHNYRKFNLFSMDLPWAAPGPGFTTLPVPICGRKAAIAICNDLNPPEELALWCVNEQIELLVICCAWLSSGNLGGDAEFEEDVEETQMEEDEAGRRLRERALAEKSNDGGDSDDDETIDPSPEAEQPKWDRSTVEYWLYVLTDLYMAKSSNCHVVICNRTGTELGNTFAGTSIMWRFQGRANVRMIGRMSAEEEGVKVWEG